MTENEIGKIVVESCIYLHRALGPGLLESAYEISLEKILTQKGLSVKRQVSIPIEFDGLKIDNGFRADLIVNDKVLLELKSLESLSNVHKKQVLTYLKLTGLKLGFLLNFGENLMKSGITRIINGELAD